MVRGKISCESTGLSVAKGTAWNNEARQEGAVMSVMATLVYPPWLREFTEGLITSRIPDRRIHTAKL